MGFLSDHELRKAIEDGHIRLDLHTAHHIKSASIDFCLGNFIYRPQSDPDGIINPADQASIDAYFGEPESPTTAGRWAKEHGVPLHNLHDDQEIFVLDPGEWVLASLAETIGLSSNPGVTCKMFSRSTFGRLGWDSWKDTGWIEPGYYGPLGLPISNDAKSRNILLVGVPIAQGLFQWAEPSERPYDQIGRYGAVGQDVECVTWKPSAILPKAIRMVK